MRVLMGRARLRAERLAEAEGETHPACNAHFVLLLGGKASGRLAGASALGRRVACGKDGEWRCERDAYIA